MLGPEFWQRLLATEAPPERLWPVVEAARAAVIDLDDVETWPGLTNPDREKALAAGLPSTDAEVKASFARTGEAPVALFVSGQASCLDRPLIGLVGTRRVSPYGRTVAAHFASRIAQAGVTVVSGGAIGVDSVAHQSAIDSGGTTACVLPCGVDVVYPARHRDLFDRIRANGCLVSPFACGVPEQDHRLLARNRLVATLCQALVIVEAPAESGSLGTARAAQQLGRPVFVVPGPVNQDTFKGSHALIREGATLVDDPDQVLVAIGIDPSRRTENKGSALTSHEQVVFDSLQGLPRSAESIGNETGLGVHVVLTALTMLEIEGVAVRTPEGYALKP